MHNVFLIMLAFIECSEVHSERYFSRKLKGFYSSERGSFIVAIFRKLWNILFLILFFFRFWFILERQWKNKFGLHGLWWRLNSLILSLVQCVRKASIWLTTFMLLLVNNAVQKMRTQVTYTISLYKLTNALFYSYVLS